MPRSFDWRSFAGSGASRGPRFWLQAGVAVLAVLNGIAIFLYLDPPGGSRRQLTAESERVQLEIAGTRAQTRRLAAVSRKVQLGSVQSGDFEVRYFLPKRSAYSAVIAEIQRMAQAAGLQERDGVYTEEPIEGTADLSLLNITANYEGPYNSLMRFLYEADRSPMLLMLDAMTASPQQKAGEINTSIRFQAIIREPAPAASGGQP